MVIKTSEFQSIRVELRFLNNLFPDTEFAQTLNDNFSNIIKELDIKITNDLQCDFSNIENPVKRAIEKYKNHPSIEKIK